MTPFSVLHVCMGNICRSPMAERLLVAYLGEHADLVYSHSAGTGAWHVGEAMNPPAARQVAARGGSAEGFGARKLIPGHIEASDLILTATAAQHDQVIELRPDAAPRTFVLGEFGRLLPGVTSLPAVALDAEGVYTRGRAVVAVVNGLRAGGPPRDGDDLDDPWGLSEATYARTADEIEATLRPLAALLLGATA